MATANAAVSRGSTSVTIPLLGEAGNLSVARDVGKPTAREQSVGREDPRTHDYFSAGDAWTVAGVLHGSTAYADAKTLAEDLIKPRATTGTPLQLDLSDLPSRGTYDVAPTSASALTLTYAPGEKDLVGVQLSVSVVASTFGGSQTDTSSSTPDSGDGIKLDRSGTSITLSNDLEVVRKVGRPNSELSRQPDTLPRLVDQNDPAADVFEISGALTGSSAESNAQTLEERIVRDRLGTDTLTLHFQGSLFTLDAYTVVPTGSQSVRTVFNTAETGMVRVPTLALRVVDNS